MAQLPRKICTKKSKKKHPKQKRQCRENAAKNNICGNAAKKRQCREHICGNAATKQKRQCSENICGNAAKKTKNRQCRIVVVRWHSSGTLRYYRANACFCLLFSQALRTLYMSPPCGRQAFASLTSSTRPSSFPRAASPRHPGLELETRNHRQIERVQRDHQRGLPTLRELTAVGRNVQFD